MIFWRYIMSMCYVPCTIVRFWDRKATNSYRSLRSHTSGRLKPEDKWESMIDKAMEQVLRESHRAKWLLTNNCGKINSKNLKELSLESFIFFLLYFSDSLFVIYEQHCVLVHSLSKQNITENHKAPQWCMHWIEVVLVTIMEAGSLRQSSPQGSIHSGGNWKEICPNPLSKFLIISCLLQPNSNS